MIDINEANQEVNELYNDLAPIIDEIVEEKSRDIDAIMRSLKHDLDTMTVNELDKLKNQLTIELYFFSASVQQSEFRQQCATILLKERQADIFNTTSGTARAKDAQALLDSRDKQTVEALHKAVSSRLKIKYDAVKKTIDSISGTIINKNAQAKLHGGVTDNDDTHTDNF